MTLVMTEGFDMYNGTGANTGLQAKWVGITSCSMQTGRFGGQCLQCVAANGAGSVRGFPAAYSSFSWGMAVRFTAMPSTSGTTAQWYFENIASAQVGFKVGPSGDIQAGRYTARNSGTNLGSASATGVIVLNVWHYVEFEIVISDTVGVINVYVDNVQVLALTGLDTRNGAPTDVGQFVFYPVGIGSITTLGTCQIDDIYLLNAATRLGERRIETLRPANDTGTKNWTPNSGTANFSRVNETTVDGDTSYVSATTSSTRDLYGISALSSTPATIDGINVVSFPLKTDATSRSIYNSIQSNAVDSDGSAMALAASYQRLDRLVLTDPSGGGAWTPTRINNLLIGPKVV